MVTMEHKQFKPTVKAHLTTLNLNNFKTIEAMGLHVKLLHGITSIPNFMKIYQAVQKLLVGDKQTDRLVNYEPIFIIGK
jgi:hypothetical protein